MIGMIKHTVQVQHNWDRTITSFSDISCNAANETDHANGLLALNFQHTSVHEHTSVHGHTAVVFLNSSCLPDKRDLFTWITRTKR
jgi:hypothetical protein